jgi:guanylate kinase
MALVVVITGPSGVGKGTLIGALRDRLGGLRLSISATTRSPRPGEVDGVDYFFLDRERFAALVDQDAFVEHADYAGERYGTLREQLVSGPADEAVLLEIEVQGARQIRETLPGALQVFIAPPSAEDLRDRLENRGTDSPETIDRRLAAAQGEMEAQGEFGRVVVNDDLTRATDELEGIVREALDEGVDSGS